MLREMPYPRFLEWQEYDRISPIGDRRGDWQAASICSAIFNSMAIKAGSGKRFATKEFLLNFKMDEDAKVEPTAPAPPWRKMKMIARLFTAQANADEARGTNREAKQKTRTEHGRRRR